MFILRIRIMARCKARGETRKLILAVQAGALTIFTFLQHLIALSRLAYLDERAAHSGYHLRTNHVVVHIAVVAHHGL